MEKVRKIAIILLNWNNAKDTLECLASLYQVDYPHYHILLVDNGSTDHSCDTILQAYPDLTVIKNRSNLGFAEGNNRGILHALKQGADYILLLNNDTTVHPDLLNAFVKAADALPTAGVFGAKIYYYDQPTTLWYAGGGVDSKKMRCYHEGCDESDLDRPKHILQETEYACGCALFVRAEVIQKVGMMDPRFFLLWEEIDWCWRIRKAGYACFFVPEAKVWHKVSASFEGGNRGPKWQYFYHRNRLLFLERHYSWTRILKFYRKIFFREILDLILVSLHPKIPKDKKLLYRAALRGVRDYFLRQFFCLNKN